MQLKPKATLKTAKTREKKGPGLHLYIRVRDCRNDCSHITSVYVYSGGKMTMIILTKLDKSPILVNLETIKYAESVPDTVIRFLNGDSVIVLESLDEIERRVLNSKAELLKKAQTTRDHREEKAES